MGRVRRRTKPSSFGVSKRENHDSSSFYSRKLYSERVAKKVDYIENPISDNVLDQILCIDSQDMLDIGYLMRGEILWDKGAGEGYTGGLSYATPEQDLAGRITETQDKYKDILKDIPKVDNQVGLCLLTMTGLESMESFNHPESWEAIRKVILGSDISSIADISDQNGLFEFREDKAKSIVRELLEKEYDEKVAVEKDSTATYILDEEKFMGEVVTLHDRPIHCAFLRKAS
ncbi:hypothetical protein ES703_06453 [subsurface metagenome]